MEKPASKSSRIGNLVIVAFAMVAVVIFVPHCPSQQEKLAKAMMQREAELMGVYATGEPADAPPALRELITVYDASEAAGMNYEFDKARGLAKFRLYLVYRELGEDQPAAEWRLAALRDLNVDPDHAEDVDKIQKLVDRHDRQIKVAWRGFNQK